MTRAAIFIFLYGSLVIVGGFLSAFWTSVMVARAKEISGRWLYYHDRYFILAAAITLLSVGLSILNTGRLIGNIVHGLSPQLQKLEAIPIGIGMVLLFFGYMIMVWLADLETDPPTYRWLKVISAATVLWLIASVLIAPSIPFYPIHGRN